MIILIFTAIMFLAGESFLRSLCQALIVGLFAYHFFKASSMILRYNPGKTDNKTNEFPPGLSPDEGYEPMNDPRGNEAANPPDRWLEKKDFQSILLETINADKINFAIEMLYNKKAGAFAITVNGQFCMLKSQLIHTDMYNSGNRQYQCKRPESRIVLSHELLNTLANKLATEAFTFNPHNNSWNIYWSHLESGEVYNTVVYDQLCCSLQLFPEKQTGNFLISTSIDTTT